LLSGTGIQAALRIVILVVLARLVAPSEFGVMSAALVILGFSDLFQQMGMGPALVQRPVLEDRHLQTAFTASLAMGVLLGGAVFLASPVIESFFDFGTLDAVLKVIALSFPVRAFSLVASALMERELRFKLVSLIGVVSYAMGYGVTGVALAYAGFGVWALVFATLGQQLLSTALTVVMQRHSMRLRFDPTAFTDLMRFGGGFTIARVFNYMALQGDNVVAGRMLGSVALGLYGRAYQLLVFPVNLISSVLDTVLFPAMAKVQHDSERLSAAFLRGSVAIALVFFPVSAMAVVLAPEVVMTVLGPRWVDVIGPFQILASGMFFRASYKMSDSLARATGAVYRRAWRQAIYALAVVGGSWVGQNWGINGLSFGVLTALVINFTLMSQLSLDLGGLSARRFIEAHGRPLLIGLVTLALCWSVATWLRGLVFPPAIVLLVGMMVPTVVVVGLLMWRRNLIGPEGRWLAATLQQFLTRRMSRA
jgi:PST family polysaccharide transporter